MSQYFENTLISFHYFNHPLLSCLSALVILLIGVFVLSKDRQSKLYRTFFIWLLRQVSGLLAMLCR